ncbi:MAG TPA: hypothetical protein EYH07_00890, partial [Kiloniellaceae bacterium]|nr:hypothetical protein [Kiloniellaceae bacterium]
QAAQAGGALGALVVRSYSREQEFEADMLGGRYLGRARYDTGAWPASSANCRPTRASRRS